MLTTLMLLTLSQTLSTPAIANDTPVHLGISLALTHSSEMQKLQRDQQDPKSAQFHRWLTPAEFGERFGQSAETYAEIVKTLTQAGFEVTRYPNRAFVGALGTAGQVQAFLNVQLAPVEGQRASVHQLIGAWKLPPSMRSVIHISGLDTRVRTRHHIAVGGNLNSMGPQDLRKFYGLDALHARGFVGQGQKLAVLSTALDPREDVDALAIQYFFTNIANATARYVKRVIPNPQGDFDGQPGGAGEFELDVQMHTVGSPGAESITLVAAPASEVFTTGAEDIANNMPDLTAISISLGICEPNAQQAYPGELVTLRNAVTQGVMEGQTWSAATGDTGADDCRNQSAAAADFPSSIPEMMALGGTSIPAPGFVNHAVSGYTGEVTWNDGQQGGAAGGGLSVVYPRPGYQMGLGLPGTGRSVPDISLIAGLPGVAVSVPNPRGALSPVEGTSVSSPLSAGFFGLVASAVGCRLGDLHDPLYALGSAQQDGGAAVFHDITSGTLTYGSVVGPAARVGYDSATGWGSLNVSALAAAWPACPQFADAGVSDGGLNGTPSTPYSACQMAGCDAGCTTLPGGPSTCDPTCTIGSPFCSTGKFCSANTVFGSPTRGVCIAGCSNDADCSATPNTACSTCTHSCVPLGSATARVGDACTSDGDCPSGGYCAQSRTFATGYCTFDCQVGVAPGAACACPSGTQCGAIGRFNPAPLCLTSCSRIGSACARSGYICQQQRTGGPVCLPPCTLRTMGTTTFDSCTSYGSSLICDVTSGICGGPRDAGPEVLDAGADAGSPADSGVEVDAGMMESTPITLIPTPTDIGTVPVGCGCHSSGSPLLFGAALLLWLLRQKR